MDIELIDVRGETRLAAHTGFSAREVMKALPGGRWSAPHRAWHYPMFFGSALTLGSAAAILREDLRPNEEAATWVASEMEEWLRLAELATTVVGPEYTGPEYQIVDGKLPTFFGHQAQCADWLSAPGAAGGRLDTSETGSGKTRATLRAAAQCWNNGETGILLVATMKSIKYGWTKEVDDMSTVLPLPDEKDWKLFTLDGSVTQRRKTIAAAVEANEKSGGAGVVLLVTHEMLRSHSRMSHYGDVALKRCPACGGPKAGEEDVVKDTACQAHEKEFNFLPLVAVVYDEAHRMMSPKGQTTRAAWWVADHAPRTWALTGTPGSTEVVANTWALLRLVMGATWPSKSKWTEYFAEAGYNSQGFWEIGRLRPEREPEFRKTYSSITRRVLKAQVLDLPPLLRGGTLVREIPMGKVQRDAYNGMKAKLRADIGDATVGAANLMAQATRLIQLAQAFGEPGPKFGEVIGFKLDKETGEEIPVIDNTMLLRMPSNKVDAVVDMVKEGDIGPGTVFQFFSTRLMVMVREALLKEKLINNVNQFGMVGSGVSDLDRSLAIEKFQTGKIPFFGFTVKAGGAGITLTRADTMVAVERPWSPILWKQAEDRVYRIGSEIHKSVTIIDLVSEGSTELAQIESVTNNRESLEEIVRDRDKLATLLLD